MKTYKQTGLLFLLAAGMAGCGGGGGGGVPPVVTTGRLSVTSDYQDKTRVVPGYADTLEILVTPPGTVTLPGTFPNPFQLNRSNGSRTLDDLEPGTYTLQMDALTDGTVVGTATELVVIVAGDFVEIDVSANLLSDVASVAVNSGDPLVTWGTSTQLIATAYDATLAILFNGAGFTWDSSDPGLVSVDQDGLVTANRLGTATITATLSGTGVTSPPFDVTANSLIALGSDLDGDDEIYVMNADGTGVVTQMTFNIAEYDNIPTFSPDGSMIAFEAFRALDGNLEVYIVDVASGIETNLTMDPNTDRHPSFNQDGSMIAFHSDRIGFLDQIYVVDTTFPFAVSLPLTSFGVPSTNPAFSPNGSRIAFEAFNEIFIMNADGTGGVPTNLTTNLFNDYAAAFSPDGLKIAFTSDRNFNTDIYVMSAVDGTGLMRLTTDLDFDEFPSFSPDGSKIVFQSFRNGSDYDIYVVNADGTGGLTRLTTGPADDRHPSFPPP